jgi:hypothetical protein|tara:strand:- start:1611 stop:1856 length:246 start_codon:yes stop_codon:yes gene_type:complete
MTKKQNTEEEEEDIVTEPPVRVNDVVEHSTLGRFEVIASSPQKAICQSDQGQIYSLAMGHLYLKQFKFPHAPNVFVHHINR